MRYNEGDNFETYDRDNIHACPDEKRGGWWFGNSCTDANLNGFYFSSGETQNADYGIYWDSFGGPNYSLKKVEMKIKQRAV